MSTYTATAVRTDVRAGQVSGDPSVPALQFSAPPEFKGRPDTWSPEHFFSAAIATCFATTFEAIAEFSKFPFEGITVSAEGVLEKGQGGYRFGKVIVRPVLSIAHDADQERALRLLEKAERGCLVSHSINSEIVLEPRGVVAAPA